MPLYEWKSQDNTVSYEAAQQWMENRVLALQNDQASECIWFLEHPPLYTLGTSGKETDVIGASQFPIFKSGRGGQLTYHGPGQRVAYVMLDLKKHKQDIRWYVEMLEEWVIQVLKNFGIKGERRKGRIGIWVQKKDLDYKIAAIGVRVQKWVTSHGLALNIRPDLSHYQNIIPCGLSQYGMTSFADLGVFVTMEEVDHVLRQTFPFEGHT